MCRMITIYSRCFALVHILSGLYLLRLWLWGFAAQLLNFLKFMHTYILQFQSWMHSLAFTLCWNLLLCVFYPLFYWYIIITDRIDMFRCVCLVDYNISWLMFYAVSTLFLSDLFCSVALLSAVLCCVDEWCAAVGGCGVQDRVMGVWGWFQ